MVESHADNDRYNKNKDVHELEDKGVAGLEGVEFVGGIRAGAEPGEVRGGEFELGFIGDVNAVGVLEA